ncbi:hypothetical protein OROHE_010646 [Orobanche hederae]
MGRKTSVSLCIAAATVTIGLVILILVFTVFKPKRPIITVDPISISDLYFKINLPKLQVHLNLTLNASVEVRNPNRAAFKYAKTSALLKYRGNDVGEAPIAAGVIGSRKALRLNLRLKLMADRLLSDSNFHSDAISGTLPLQTEVRLPGKVRLLYGAKVVAHASCDLEIHLVRKTLVNQTCHYKTKL